MTGKPIASKEELIDYLKRGHQVKYLLFWGHQPTKDGFIAKTCFSQWFEIGFDIEGVHYRTAEHFMMAQKARLFNDAELLEEILVAPHPGAAKKLGRKVAGFDDEVWCESRFSIVVQANHAKFTQNPDLETFLLGTGDRILVEASPQDRIWGIGLDQNNRDAENPEKWRGLNLLGFALMQVRDQIRS